MGSLPTIKRFSLDDYPKEEQSWISTLLSPLNLLLTTIFSNLNNGLTIAQNMQAQIKISSISGASASTSIPWNFSKIGAPIGVSIINTVCTSSTTPITAPVTCQWSYSAGTIAISQITGLISGNTYNITFIVWGG